MPPKGSNGPISARPLISRLDGERTGAYELHGEEFAPNSRGESIISYADYAIALVDEIEKAAHVGQRISVVRA